MGSVAIRFPLLFDDVVFILVLFRCISVVLIVGLNSRDDLYRSDIAGVCSYAWVTEAA